MSARMGTITTTAALLGAANASYTLYEKVLRRPRLRVEQRFSWMAACGPDALVYQVDMRLRADHKDVYLHDVYLNNLPGWWDRDGPHQHEPDEIKRLEVPRFYAPFEARLGYDLDPEDFTERIEAAGAGMPTQDLKLAAGGILTVTVAGIVRQPGAARHTRKYGWRLELDYGVGRAQEKIFHEI